MLFGGFVERTESLAEVPLLCDVLKSADQHCSNGDEQVGGRQRDEERIGDDTKAVEAKHADDDEDVAEDGRRDDDDDGETLENRCDVEASFDERVAFVLERVKTVGRVDAAANRLIVCEILS